MNTNSPMMKLFWAVSAAMVLAFVPRLASAQSAAADQAGSTLKLTLSAPGSSEVGTLRFGGTMGVALGDHFTGFALRPQFAYTVSELDRNLYLDVAGHLGLTLGGGTGYSQQYWEVVPAVRLRYAVSPKVALYGDLGFGFAAVHTSIDNSTASDTSMGAVLRFPFGLQYAVSPKVDLVFEPAGFNVYFNGNGNKFIYSLSAGALFRI